MVAFHGEKWPAFDQRFQSEKYESWITEKDEATKMGMEDLFSVYALAVVDVHMAKVV